MGPRAVNPQHSAKGGQEVRTVRAGRTLPLLRGRQLMLAGDLRGQRFLQMQQSDAVF